MTTPTNTIFDMKYMLYAYTYSTQCIDQKLAIQTMKKAKTQKTKRPLAAISLIFLACFLLRCVLLERLELESSSSSVPVRVPVEYSYDPKNCSRLVNGHCDDQDGGAWTYRHDGGHCSYTEKSPLINNAPKDGGAVTGLPKIFPSVQSVMDFGGGVGVYLTGFRNKGVSRLVTVEPHLLGNCVFSGITQDTIDWINTPLSELPSNKYDLVMTVEVAEHIPVHYHRHLLQALAQATSQWLVFSAAHPGQPGEGHVGPSMKRKEQWIDEIHNWTSLQLDMPKTLQFHKLSGSLLRTNSAIFRKV